MLWVKITTVRCNSVRCWPPVQVYWWWKHLSDLADHSLTTEPPVPISHSTVRQFQSSLSLLTNCSTGVNFKSSSLSTYCIYALKLAGITLSQKQFPDNFEMTDDRGKKNEILCSISNLLQVDFLCSITEFIRFFVCGGGGGCQLSLADCIRYCT